MRKINIDTVSITYDETDPEPYRAGMYRVGSDLDGKRLGASIYELPPGQTVCPYHYESDEEWLLVLRGAITLRHPDGEDVLDAGDMVAFPTGPAGAHKTSNHTDQPARIMIFSTHDAVGYCVYPDSNKMAVWTDSSDPRDNLRVHRAPELDYYEGEV